ncbi:MAG: GGDEF domain-containing protein [Candidatus Devosia phytovorans]|uniref:diguanylate cyclase n=1 Tax=Candidatus Devosia phytovorans TaxID=3121372 RepID=A0AAJ5VY81_9HYPH|nr:GGDEF domain-containing protein [Devosia sp.]WEK05644.1 MAG: GGDEF domain-containing protein [Devosia sp.]
MTGHFFFTLLNPGISAILVATFLLLWRKRPDQTYLGMLALAFLTCGLAFVVNDFLPGFDSIASRVAANLFFLVAIASACIGALLRVKTPVPTTLFVVTSLASAAGFMWFLVIAPSTEARIYVVSVAYVIITATTAWKLFRVSSLKGLDWLFIGLTLGLTALSILRPAATLLKQLDTNAGGSFRDSAYWATVQAATPILAIAIGLAFLAALALKLFDELSLEANRDFLTGLLNRRGFDKGVQKLHASLRDHARPGVMIIDIDNFKLVNDSYGHGVGDNVIASVAHILSLRGDADLVSRTGGEEFTLFYRDINRTDLLDRAADIRGELAQASFSAIPADHVITLSVGLHSGHRKESITEMMADADRALYDAKRTGKDRAILGAPQLRAVPDTLAHHTDDRLRA